MHEVREKTMIQVVVNDRRNWVEICRFDYLFTMHLLGQDLMGESVYGEGFTLEDAMEMFCKNWMHWNECGPY